MIKLLIEAFVVGIITVIVGSIVGFIVGRFYPMKVELPKKCKTYNKYFIMEVSLFFTGFFAHLLFDITGGNKWYCKNGVACRKNK